MGNGDRKGIEDVNRREQDGMEKVGDEKIISTLIYKLRRLIYCMIQSVLCHIDKIINNYHDC